MNSPNRQPELSHGSQQATRGTLRISETFSSRQGEGKLTGTETFFIRTSGCNLRCWFCDTPYASWSPTGDRVGIDTLVDQALGSGHRHVVLTGGEPLIEPAAAELIRQLQSHRIHVTIETAGTVGFDAAADLMSISPKLAGSAPDAIKYPKWHQLHQQRRLPIDVMKSLIERSKDFQIKFVVDNEGEYDEIRGVVAALGVGGDDVWIMPQGSDVEALDAAIEWLKPWADSQGYHYCDRMQIRWYGNRRGT